MPRMTYGDIDSLFREHQVGGVARVNHETSRCGGSSRSMRITETDDGGLTFKCFRCGVGGTEYPSAMARRQAARSRGEHVEPEHDDTQAWRHEFPSGMRDPVRWSKQSRDWLLQYLSVGEAGHREVVEAHDRLWLPVTLDGAPVKWPGRRIYDDDGVKYLTGQVPDYSVHDPALPEAGAVGKPLVMVEDAVSAWVIADKLGLPAYPLLSTHLTRAVARHMYMTLTRHKMRGIAVWLDNDNAHVNRAARRVARDMQGYGVHTTVFRDLGDPKRAICGMRYSQYPDLIKALEAP